MTITLDVQKREAGDKLVALRAQGKMPAVVYGPKQEAINLVVDEKVFEKVRHEAGESTIVNLAGLEEEVEVLIKQVDFDPVKQRVAHADLYAIERGKEMTATVAFEFIGEAPAEKNNIGSVTKAMQEIGVTCLPRHLPSHVDVDVSSMDAEDSKITVADLPTLEGVTYNAEAEDPVAVISVAKEEVDEDPEAVDMDAVASEEKGAEAADDGGENGEG